MNIKRKLGSLKDTLFKVLGASGLITGAIGVVLLCAVIAALPFIIIIFVIRWAFPGILS